MLAAKRIAVVGLSDDPSAAELRRGGYLRSVGKEIIPVNPNHETVMGLKCYPSLAAVPGADRPRQRLPPAGVLRGVVREAVEVGAKGVWLQSGIRNAEAREIARKAGIDYVENRCLKVDTCSGTGADATASHTRSAPKGGAVAAFRRNFQSRPTLRLHTNRRSYEARVDGRCPRLLTSLALARRRRRHRGVAETCRVAGRPRGSTSCSASTARAAWTA